MSSTYLVIHIPECDTSVALSLVSSIQGAMQDHKASVPELVFGLDEQALVGRQHTLSIDGAPRFEAPALTLFFEAAPSVSFIWLEQIMVSLRGMTAAPFYIHTFNTQDSSALFFRFVEPSKAEMLSSYSPVFTELSELAENSIEQDTTLLRYIELNQEQQLEHELALDLDEIKIARMRQKGWYRAVVWFGRIALFGGIGFALVKCSQAIF